ncbi:MAG: PmeII family type II restriction endonuclease [Candidatus Helarchaeota archaeon]
MNSNQIQDDEELFQSFLKFILTHECKFSKVKAEKISNQFIDFEEFITFDFKKLKKLKSPSGRQLIRITDEEIEKIDNIIKKGYVLKDLNLKENFIRAIDRDFLNRQLINISSITLEKLNPNPFLGNALNFKKVEDLIEFLVFQRAARSIVTSFGFYFEKLLISAGAIKLPKGFDIIKIINGISHYIQVKSGTSDMDKDQILHWEKLITETELRGNRGYIGMPYGKRDSNAITISLMKSYLPEWENRTLIGKELWDFISGEKNFHLKVLMNLKISASQILNNEYILIKIREAIQRVLQEFYSKFGKNEDNIEKYYKNLF